MSEKNIDIERFYSLLESSLGDIKPLLVESDIEENPTEPQLKELKIFDLKTAVPFSKKEELFKMLQTPSILNKLGNSTVNNLLLKKDEPNIFTEIGDKLKSSGFDLTLRRGDVGMAGDILNIRNQKSGENFRLNLSGGYNFRTNQPSVGFKATLDF